MHRKTKTLHTSITVSPTVQTLAFCISLISDVYYPEQILRTLCHHFGFDLVKR